MGRLKAWILLGWAFLCTLWLRITFRAPGGLSQFRAQYAPDRLTNLSPEQRLELGSYGGCIACGLCNRGDAVLMQSSEGRFQGTMTLVLAATRSMPDFAAAERGLSHLTDEQLLAKEQLCPVGVPLRKLAAFVHSHARQARESVPAAPPTSNDR